MTKDAKRISEQELDKVAGGELGWDIYDPLNVKRDKEPSSHPFRDEDIKKILEGPCDPIYPWDPWKRPHIPDGEVVIGDKKDLDRLVKGN